MMRFESLLSPRFIRFFLIAGMGWVLDFSIYSLLLHLHIRVAVANVLGALIGVTFAYFMSVRAVFYYEGNLLLTKWVIYVFYNAIIILFFSFSIEYLSKYFNTSPIFMKCYVTPITMIMNFLMMTLLLDNRLQYRVGS